MANPQKENGHIEIANEIAEALMKINLSPYESRILWFIFRKTYGWQKKLDRIALSQFSKEVGLDRRLVHRAIKSLYNKNIIVISRDDKNKIRYGFQKNYERWNLSSAEMTVISRDDTLSSAEMTKQPKVSSVEIPTKEIYKETITKEKKAEFILPEWISKESFNAFIEMRKKIRKPATEKAMELLIKKLKKFMDQGYNPNDILNESIMNSWQGVFLPKEKQNNDRSYQTRKVIYEFVTEDNAHG